MDPKLSALDPKLRETYERVMGTQLTPPPAQSNQLPTAPVVSSPPPQNNQNPQLITTSDIVPPSPQSQEQSQPQQNAASPIPSEVNQSSIPPTLVTQSPIVEPQPTPQVTQPFIANQQPPTPFLGNQTSKMQGKKSGILPIIYVLGGIIFFAAYILFWIKFFEIPVPFLPF